MSLDVSRGSWGPLSKSVFGGADYAYHRQQGMSSRELLNWVDSNMNKFSPGPKNQPGGGGLYDMMVRNADTEDRLKLEAQRRKEDQAFMKAQADRELEALNKLATVPVYNNQSMSIGNNQNAGGVRSKATDASKSKSASKGTYSLNRRTMQPPLNSILGLGIQ